MTFNEIITFKQFCYKEGILDKFFLNLSSFRLNRNLQTDINSFLKNVIASGVIDFAFLWSASPEGHNFWSNFNKKWASTIKKP